MAPSAPLDPLLINLTLICANFKIEIVFSFHNGEIIHNVSCSYHHIKTEPNRNLSLLATVNEG